MDVFKIVIDFCIGLLNTSISFGTFTFTFGQAWLGLACLAIVIGFVVKLFDV